MVARIYIETTALVRNCVVLFIYRLWLMNKFSYFILMKEEKITIENKVNYTEAKNIANLFHAKRRK